MSYPQVEVLPSAAKRVRHFDCWVFRDEVAAPDASVEPGALVELIDRHGAFVAYAFYNARAAIAARVVSTVQGQPLDRAFLAGRLRAALARRAGLTDTNAKRLVFSEADGLPGLIVDQYADYLVLQSRTAGIERWKSLLVDLLRDLLHPKGILERSDKEFREEEGLPAITAVLRGDIPERIPIEEQGLRFLVDARAGLKTGFFLDQRRTRQLLRSRIRPGQRVADAFAYTGAFGIGSAAAGARVVCIEQQEAFLALAKEHAALNGVADRVEFVAGDAFYWLQMKAKGRERFDWILLDPPSLAKSKAEVLHGRQALHRLLVAALGALTDTGCLVLSVCTYHLLGLVEEILRIAAAEQGARLRVEDLSMQDADHPWILQMPMTRYLMSWWARRDG